MDGGRPIRHTVVLSDVHLCEAAPERGDWMRWRVARWFPDEELRALVAHLLAHVGPGDSLDLVLGGDCFEFEASPDDGETGPDRLRDEAETEGIATATMGRIATDHPVFLGALAAVLRAGHRVAVVVGNHDAALCFPAVQRVLRASVLDALGALPAEAVADARRRLQIFPWFFQTADGVHVEHGHQYDPYCAFRDPLRPFDPRGRIIHPTVGSLVFRYIGSRLGYFNANDDRSFAKTFGGIMSHWARRWLFSRRSMWLRWFVGAVRVVIGVVRYRPTGPVVRLLEEQAEATRTAWALAQGLDPNVANEHARLFARPADEDPRRLVRDLRLDHAGVAVFGLIGLFTAAFKPRLGLSMALGALAVGVAQEILAPRLEPEDQDRVVGRAARAIAKVHHARAVVFGHTHHAQGEVEDGVLYANTGSFSALPEAPDLPKPPSEGRPLLWLRRPAEDPTAPLEGGLYGARGGALRPKALLPGTEPTPR